MVAHYLHIIVMLSSYTKKCRCTLPCDGCTVVIYIANVRVIDKTIDVVINIPGYQKPFILFVVVVVLTSISSSRLQHTSCCLFCQSSTVMRTHMIQTVRRNVISESSDKKCTLNQQIQNKISIFKSSCTISRWLIIYTVNELRHLKNSVSIL